LPGKISLGALHVPSASLVPQKLAYDE